MTGSTSRGDPYASDSAPRARPLAYPGRRPPFSALVTSDELIEIRDRDGTPLAWSEDRPHPLASCRVGAAPRLGALLDERGAAPLDARVPVLAIGSNAAPSQLRHKFLADPASLLIPSIRARAHGVRAAFCAFVSPLGYVPATLVRERGAVAEMALQLLDDAQLAEIDRTERGAYRRVWVEAPILLETGEELPGAYAYAARGGCLTDGAGAWVMGAPGDRRPDDVDPARWYPDQRSLLARLAGESSLAADLGPTPEEIVVRRPSVEESAAALAAAGLVSAAGSLEELDDAIGAEPRRWGGRATG